MVTLNELIAKLRQIFADDKVDVAEVMRVMESYKSNPADWRQFAVFDEHKYTRNLVDVGNGKYNLMILCWGPGMGSRHTSKHIHDLKTRISQPENPDFSKE
ncbi:cysteine dioxygenase type I [Ancylostoma duodenale]|uniref:Cysteine dioxygenase n=1 Tax=Ancylostoma duodenale TaxID=51022 RepID=A0A0C2CSD0_9BILA|nr:cysteine dioxygenase type I [Ancylostoma duodenale]